MFDRVIVLGIDGLDPHLTERFMQDGDLPHFSALRNTGAYARSATSNPPQSPVAWSDIGTGTDSGSHDVFDFILRHPKKYLPDLSILRANKQNLLGSREKMFEPTCRAKFFWDYTAEAGIPSVSIRWPMTFPPHASGSKVLAGLGVPDIKGGLGRYLYFSTNPSDKAGDGAEKKVLLIFSDNKATAQISGPYTMGITGKKEATIPLEIEKRDGKTLRLSVAHKTFDLAPGQWSDWIPMEFSGGPLKKISGIGKFYLVSSEPDINLYLTPLQVNPKDPCFIISSPDDYARELGSDLGGYYYTLGIPEDTKPLNEGAISDEAFIEMCDAIMKEREKMLHSALGKFKDGVFSFVIDTTDRIQHMFWRFEDKNHPLYTPEGEKRYGQVIRDYYKWSDRIVGDVMKEQVNDRTLFIVLSDHGFNTFRTGVNINRWLIERGYMSLKEKPDPQDKEGGALFRHVDWNKTSAYSLGFSSIYLNLKGREGSGIVQPGSEAKHLAQKIAEDLTSFKDPAHTQQIVKNVYLPEQIYAGKYIENSPDLIIGFAAGYRMSWQTAIGGTPEQLVEPNLKKWSGDHIVDPALVSGILFVNRKIATPAPKSLDIAPTVLTAMGIKPPREIKGKSLI
jgi:predicted AlkP superfamily phosphohydrolase/phosphomutase